MSATNPFLTALHDAADTRTRFPSLDAFNADTSAVPFRLPATPLHPAPSMTHSRSSSAFTPSSAFGKQLLESLPPAPSPFPSHNPFSQAPPPTIIQTYTSTIRSVSDRPQQPFAMEQSSASRGGHNGWPEHPREYVTHNKAELESWDSYSWKQLTQAFEALLHAWEARHGEARVYEQNLSQSAFARRRQMGVYFDERAAQSDFRRVQELKLTAQENSDSVAAAILQLQEVHSGYRASSDPASKRRVRDSMNAALAALPAWPPREGLTEGSELAGSGAFEGMGMGNGGGYANDLLGLGMGGLPTDGGRYALSAGLFN